ncbi:hypothetical protein AB0K26_20230, partial [Streptomyces sp. NPDC049555]
MIDYLRRRQLLAEALEIDADLARARRIAARLPEPFDAAVNTWVDVLTGTGKKPSLPIAAATACRYVRDVEPVLRSWAADGITSLREITKKHVEDAIEDKDPRARHVALRSLFRAMRRERLVFRDPARVAVVRPCLRAVQEVVTRECEP